MFSSTNIGIAGLMLAVLGFIAGVHYGAGIFTKIIWVVAFLYCSFCSLYLFVQWLRK